MYIDITSIFAQSSNWSNSTSIRFCLNRFVCSTNIFWLWTIWGDRIESYWVHSWGFVSQGFPSADGFAEEIWLFSRKIHYDWGIEKGTMSYCFGMFWLTPPLNDARRFANFFNVVLSHVIFCKSKDTVYICHMSHMYSFFWWYSHCWCFEFHASIFKFYCVYSCWFSSGFSVGNG